MTVKIILLLLMIVFVIGAVALIKAGQYLYKEKLLKMALDKFLNSSVGEYPSHQAGKRPFFWKQILAAIAILFIFCL
jgi:hypothetical protein